MEIVQVPNPILKQKARPIKNFGAETKKLAQKLTQALDNAQTPGAGLAAPQIGISKRMFLARKFFHNPAGEEKYIDIIMVNPQIITTSKETDVEYEACLSIPNTYGRVERPIKVKIRYTDMEGNDQKLKASGFLARVIQHEYDHIEGVLFTDKIIGKPLTKDEITRLSQKETL